MMTKQKKKVDKEFKLSSWAINNKTTIYAILGVFFSMESLLILVWLEKISQK